MSADQFSDLELEPKQVLEFVQDSSGSSRVRFLDIRPLEEVQASTAKFAQLLPRDTLEIELEKRRVGKDETLILMCQSGKRSGYAAHALRALDYRHAYSVVGGLNGWAEAQLPMEQVKLLTNSQRQRYSRQLKLPMLNEEGQATLLESTVSVVGAGGLSSPALLYLAAAGVGTIRIIDHDVVELSNLHRQIAHNENNLGVLKALSAQQTLQGINPEVNVIAVTEKVTESNVDEIVSNSDVVMNGADNFKLRYILNDACVKYRKPLVDASVLEMRGQLSVYNTSENAPCYRCLYPEPPPAEIAPSCTAAGVLGAVPGVLGCLQAIEVVKVLLKQGNTLNGRLLNFDAETCEFEVLNFEKREGCQCSRLGNVDAVVFE